MAHFNFGNLFKFESFNFDDACIMKYYDVELVRDMGPYKTNETFHVLCLNVCTGEFYVYKTLDDARADNAMHYYPLN